MRTLGGFPWNKFLLAGCSFLRTCTFVLRLVVHFVISEMKWQQSLLSFLCSDKNKRSQRQTGNNAIKSNYFYVAASFSVESEEKIVS